MAEEKKKTNRVKHLSDDALTGDQRGEALRHLLRCPACRKKVTEKNPSALFSLLSVQKKEAEFWRVNWPPVVEHVFAQPRSRFVWLPVPAFKPVVYAAVSLMVSLLALYFFYERGQEEWQQPGAGIAREMIIFPVETEAFSDVPLVENIEPANAVVYDMGIIDEDQTRMVHFFNIDVDI